MAHTDFAGTVAARMKQLGYGQHAISKVLRPLSAPEAACSASFSHVTPVEEELMRHLHASGLGVKRIAGALGRSTDTISKHLFRRCKAKPARVGRKVCITDSNYKRIFKGYKHLLKNARGKEVTVKMVKKELKLKCSVKTLSRAFWAHGVHFRSLYEKPDLSPQDVKVTARLSPNSYLRTICANVDQKVTLTIRYTLLLTTAPRTVDGRIIQTLIQYTYSDPPHPKYQCYFLVWFVPSNGRNKSNPQSRNSATKPEH